MMAVCIVFDIHHVDGSSSDCTPPCNKRPIYVAIGTRSFHLDDSDDEQTLPPNASETRVLLSGDEHIPRYLTASPCM